MDLSSFPELVPPSRPRHWSRGGTVGQLQGGRVGAFPDGRGTSTGRRQLWPPPQEPMTGVSEGRGTPCAWGPATLPGNTLC